MADVFTVFAQPFPGSVCVFAGIRENFTGYRWTERRALPGVRQKREIYLVRSQHRFRPFCRLVGSDQLSASGIAKYLCRGVEERRTVAGRARKRRRKNRACEVRGKIQGREEGFGQGQRQQ